MGNVNLSERMEAVVSMVSSQSFTVADVGCDHAYVSIALVRRKLAARVIAMDVRKGPLAIACDNVRTAGMEKEIDLRLSDGLEGLMPDEADTIIIAGMGGLLMKSILKRGRHILDAGVKRPVLILQPQSDLPEVRIFLYHCAYHIVHEKMLVEDGKYYTVMRAEPCSAEAAHQEAAEYTPADWLYGMDNLKRTDSVLYTYLQREGRRLREVGSRLAGELKRSRESGIEPSPRIRERLCTLQENIQVNEAALEKYRL